MTYSKIVVMKNDPATERPVIASSAILDAQGLSFHFSQHELFTKLFIHIPPGVTLVRGGDGRGKTTLLRLLAGELPAHAGELTVNDIGLKDQPMTYRQQVFWTDPRSNAFDQMTPADYFKSLHCLYPRFDKQFLSDLMEGLSLAPHLEKPLYMLSTGSKRKVWLAAAFASSATVTLLDEPFAALDKASIGFVMELLEDAADHPARAWVIADYEAPGDVPLAAMIDVGD